MLFLILITVIGFLVSILVSPQFFLIAIFTTLVLIISLIKRGDSSYPKKMIVFITLFYIVEILIKLNFKYDLVPYSWRILNTFEHIMTSAYVFILIFSLSLARQFVVNLLLSISFVLFIGVSNEIFEFFIRDFGYNSLGNMGAVYYVDTIIDMAANLIGLVIGFCLIVLFGYYFKRDDLNE